MQVKARGWLAFGFGAGAVLWSLGLVLAALIVPAYSGESCEAGPGGAATCGALPSETLVGANGWFVVELLLAVALVAALAFWALHVRCARGSEHALAAAVFCIVVLAVFSFLTGFSIGLFVFPVVLLLIVSAALTPSP
jgi:hypothetical protein